MSELVRFGIAIESDLLRSFDTRNRRKKYSNRSEAIRDLIRAALVADSFESSASEKVGVLSMVYDHHRMDLPKKLTRTQHDHHSLVIATVHVHLDHHNCLEILVLKGKGREIQQLADRILSTRGVKHGSFALMGDGKSP